MRGSRINIFNRNRNLPEDPEEIEMANVEELQQQIQQMQLIIQQQDAQLEQLRAIQQNGVPQQQQQQNQPQALEQLGLSTEGILNQFRRLKAFNGSGDYSLTSFIRSVETTASLCGQNQALYALGMQIVFYEKIQGEAEKCIRQLSDNLTWDAVVTKLKQHFQPNKSYAELFNYCRYVKVSNLRELFDEFKNTSYLLNELYMYDERKPEIYKPENIDRDLVEILIEKIDGNIRAHIEENSTMIEIYNKYARLRLLDDERTIDINHRKTKSVRYNGDKHFQKPVNKNMQANMIKNSNNNNNFSKQYTPFQRNFNHNSGQFRRPQNFPNNSGQFNRQGQGYNRSGQFNRQINSNNDFRHNRQNGQQNSNNNNNINPNEPMEIDNIQHAINFCKKASDKNLPFVYLTIGNQNIRALIDTGSSTSLVKPNIFSNFDEERLEKPLYYSTINGINEVTNKIVTPLPKEFNMYGTISWKVVELPGRSYDAIIGQNILKNLKAKIDLKNNFVEFNDNKIMFTNEESPYNVNSICSLEASDKPISDNLKLDHLNVEEKEAIIKLFKEYEELFYKEGDTLTATHEIQHEIITTTNNPIFSKIYRYPQAHEKEIEKQINEMLKQGIIKESNSPYNSPLWIVPKKKENSGKQKWRIVIDYRKLNEVTISDKFPIPNIDGILDKLGRAHYFTTLDLAKGFHQIMMKPEDTKKTAFSTPFGHYEYVRMPFGLKNAPSTFQRLMNSVLREYMNKICVVYLDDILVFSTSLEEHLANLRKIFDKLKASGLKVQVDKCNFLCRETEYLGHVLTSEGVKPNMNKIKVIRDLKLPTSRKQIKSFLGITGYYRKFIKDYAKIAYPITKCLKKGATINENNPNFVAAFEKLKELITNYPILKYPDFNKKFKLVTDASDFALGAVLTQDGHPICYASRTLNEHEKHYSTIEKELLALVWGTKYFRPYLFGKEFDLQTDHQPIKWLQTKYTGKDINPRLQRWLVQLGEYDIKIDYIKGKENKVADFLSRINKETNEINLFDFDPLEKDLSEFWQNESVDQVNDNESLELETVHSQEENLNNHIAILETVVNRFKTQIIILKEKEKEFEEIHKHRRIYIEENDIPDNLADIFRRYISKGKIGIYSELEDTIYNRVQQKLIELFSGCEKIKFIKCSYFAKDIESEEDAIKQISLYHKNESGHSGMVANYEGIKNKIYFPKLKFLIHKVVNNCDICTAAKYDRKPIKKKFEFTETPSSINEIIHVDTYVNSKHHFINFIDKFSKHAVCFHLEDRNSLTLVEKLRQFISIKGKIKKIIGDNEFNTINFKEFCKQEGIETHFAKPHSHTGNSDVERLNNTITEKIRTLNLEEKLPITQQIFKAVEHYNNTYHSTIKATPLDVQNGKIRNEIIKERIADKKKKVIEKRNKDREDYHETRDEGFIKNYASLRHKEKPKFRKHKLQGVHENNIKRPFKFSGQDHVIHDTNNDDATNQPTEDDNREDRI